MKLKDYLAEERGRAAVVARALGEPPAYLSQMASGRRPVPAPLVPALVHESGGRVRHWDLRPDDWHRIWPELIGQEGAPAVACNQEAA